MGDGKYGARDAETKIWNGMVGELVYGVGPLVGLRFAFGSACLKIKALFPLLIYDASIGPRHSSHRRQQLKCSHQKNVTSLAVRGLCSSIDIVTLCSPLF